MDEKCSGEEARQIAPRGARHAVTYPNHLVHTRRHDLRINRLGSNVNNRILVSREDVDLRLGPHVPHSAHCIPPRSHEDVESRVKGQGVHAAEVAMVLANRLVLLQVPT